jgi:hypothetical protein
MLKLTLTLAAVTLLTASHACRADHIINFYFEGTISLIDGNAPPPFGVTPGDPLSLQYTFKLPDARCRPRPCHRLIPRRDHLRLRKR